MAVCTNLVRRWHLSLPLSFSPSPTLLVCSHAYPPSQRARRRRKEGFCRCLHFISPLTLSLTLPPLICPLQQTSNIGSLQSTSSVTSKESASEASKEVLPSLKSGASASGIKRKKGTSKESTSPPNTSDRKFLFPFSFVFRGIIENQSSVKHYAWNIHCLR